jgi:hypothetical protein
MVDMTIMQSLTKSGKAMTMRNSCALLRALASGGDA